MWSYDTAMVRANDGRAVRILVTIAKYTRECLFIHVARTIKHQDVLDQLYELLIKGDIPEPIHSDNTPEFTSKTVRGWLAKIGVRTLFIEPGSPWENEYVESFIGKLRDELLNGEILDTFLETREVIECWRRENDQFRPHSSLGYRPPAPEAIDHRVLTLQV